MRNAIAITALVILAGCSKPSAPAGQAPNAVSAEPPPALTDAQKKALLADLPAAYQGADLDNGQAKFAICKTCHTVTQGGGSMTGPDLYGVFGRKAGTSPGYAYSDGLKALGVTWDAETIDKWIANPHAMVPGTKMTYIGMSNAKDRTDLIAYLKTVTSPPPAG
jgi:cytochrome c